MKTKLRLFVPVFFRRRSALIAAVAAGSALMALTCETASALNPQPLPPGFMSRALNPQPLPPGRTLNPQPLPPGFYSPYHAGPNFGVGRRGAK